MAKLTNLTETISETLRQNITFSTQEPHYLKNKQKNQNIFINNLLSIILNLKRHVYSKSYGWSILKTMLRFIFLIDSGGGFLTGICFLGNGLFFLAWEFSPRTSSIWFLQKVQETKTYWTLTGVIIQ